MDGQNQVRIAKSSIFGLHTNVLSALVYVVPALFAWIPVIGYFAWIIPMLVFMTERKSNFVRFSAAQAFCIGLARLVFDVVFDSIHNTALRTVALYGQSHDFISFWGAIETPGATASMIGDILGILLCAIGLVAATMAFLRKLWRMPILGKISEFMTTQLKPKFKHKTYQ